MKFKEKIAFYKEQIIGNTSRLLGVLKIKISKDSRFNNEILLFESRFKKLEVDNRKNIITKIDYDNQMNKLENSLLELLDSLQEEDIVESIVNEESKLDNANQEKRDVFLQTLKSHGLKRRLNSKEEGLILYLDTYQKLCAIFKSKLSEYSELAFYKLEMKETKMGVSFYTIDKISLNIYPCVDERKRFLWIQSVAKEKDKNTELTLDVFKLIYSDKMELVWLEADNNKTENADTFTNEQICEIICKKVFEYLINLKQ